MNKKIVIACSKKWFLNEPKIKKFIKRKNIILITERKKLKYKFLKKINPTEIFFPHWSYKVNNIIYNNFKCICFHTAPLPFGRGGSPIQNLIIRNFKKTPVCAIKMTNVLDGGPIYLKENVSLSGNLEKIFQRISLKILDMIKILISKNINPKKQTGLIYKFKRIKEKNSQIKNEKNIFEIYDKIRMLDAENYPKAFIKINKFNFSFTNAILKNNSIMCNVKINTSKK